MATRRYKVEWDLDHRMRSTTYTTIEAARREIHKRLYAEGHLKSSAALWDGEARTWTTYRLVQGGLTRGGGRRNPNLQWTAGA